MAIIKIQKKENPYVTVDKAAVSDIRLSWRARGLLCYLLSLPADWQVHVNHLITQSPDGRDVIYNTITELKKYGYMQHIRQRDQNGRISAGQYMVYETPAPALFPEKPEEVDSVACAPDTAFPYEGKPVTDLPNQVKKPIQINNKTNEISLQKNKTAAIGEEQNDDIQPAQKLAAVSFFPRILKDADLLIGENLTDVQQQYLSVALSPLSIPDISQEQLHEEFCYSLLNPNYFSAAGNDFVKKLNTMLKLIREGRWSSPAGLQQAKETAEQKSKNNFQYEYNMLHAEFQQLQRHKDFFKERNDEKEVHFYQQEIEKTKQKLERLSV